VHSEAISSSGQQTTTMSATTADKVIAILTKTGINHNIACVNKERALNIISSLNNINPNNNIIQMRHVFIGINNKGETKLYDECINYPNKNENIHIPNICDIHNYLQNIKNMHNKDIDHLPYFHNYTSISFIKIKGKDKTEITTADNRQHVCHAITAILKNNNQCSDHNHDTNNKNNNNNNKIIIINKKKPTKPPTVKNTHKVSVYKQITNMIANGDTLDHRSCSKGQKG
jgi:hypothetical protein